MPKGVKRGRNAGSMTETDNKGRALHIALDAAASSVLAPGLGSPK